MIKKETSLLHPCERCCEEEWINSYYRICLGCLIIEEIEQKKEEVMCNEL